MLANVLKNLWKCSVCAIVVSLAIWLVPSGRSESGGQTSDKKTAESKDAVQPFAPAVGQYYQVFKPNGQPWPGDRQLIQIQKTYSNGWVQVKDPSGQTTWLNLNQVMNLYLIEDVTKWRRIAGPDTEK